MYTENFVKMNITNFCLFLEANIMYNISLSHKNVCDSMKSLKYINLFIVSKFIVLLYFTIKKKVEKSLFYFIKF